MVFAIKLPILNATCNDEVAQQLSKNVLVQLETVNEGTVYYHTIKISNIVQGVYVVVKEDDANSFNTYSFQNVPDNFLIIKVGQIYKKINYKIEVYSDYETCKDELMNTIELVTPKVNPYTSTQICLDNKEYKKCALFEDTEGLTIEQLKEEIDEYNEKLNMTPADKFINLVKNYSLYIVIPIVLIGGFFTYRTINIRKRSTKI